MSPLLRPRSADELTQMLRASSGQVRLSGTGSRQERLPDNPTATTISLLGLDAIHRLDAADQTCSVGAGVTRAALDAALQAVGLMLPCAGQGTLGGLLASDPTGATTSGGASPRSLLLGMEAVLADGTAFRSGSRVVKSVAGFDVHKLLVGSQGRLFAATQLHLRLRPRPRAEAWFFRPGLEQDEAVRSFTQLRNLAAPPANLHLQRTAAGFVLAGCVTGRPSAVAATLRQHQLPSGPVFDTLHLPAPEGGEVLTGLVLPSHLPALLAMLPADAPFLLHGGGRFEVALATPTASDALLAALPNLSVQACISLGASARRGHGTPLDPGHQRLTVGLKLALDPHGVFV